MKRIAFVFAAVFTFAAGAAFAENINEAYNGSDSRVVGTADSSETSTVDLSDKNTDQPVQSPSQANTTPAGQAPGQPIEN